MSLIRLFLSACFCVFAASSMDLPPLGERLNTLTSTKSGNNKTPNDFPVIGMLTQPSSSTQGNCGGSCLYLAASYVKYLESAGARVVPINYYANNDELDTLFSSLNGLFFVGGGAAFPPSAQYLFDKVVAANDAGDFFPLWGTCMGFQWLLIAASRDTSILDPKQGQMDSYNYSIPLEFIEPAASASKLFSSAPAHVMDILGNQNVTMNNHHYGIYPQHFADTPSLTSFFTVLSTNVDRQGTPFVSTIEGIKYPIFGSQWHPEKNAFEWAMVVEEGGGGTLTRPLITRTTQWKLPNTQPIFSCRKRVKINTPLAH